MIAVKIVYVSANPNDLKKYEASGELFQDVQKCKGEWVSIRNATLADTNKTCQQLLIRKELIDRVTVSK